MGSAEPVCTPLDATYAKMTPADVEKRVAMFQGSNKIPDSHLVKSRCKDLDILLITNGYTSEMYVFRQGKLVGTANGTDYGPGSCQGEQAPFPCPP